ncbi:MAG TPA: protoporphyrinogen oxidase [Bryobacteraceae bacterium]|nr:protoporphyrinogen oxidase [Bryobacteraceae bacterium]
MSEPKIAIIGAGISGLATAYFLAQHGLRSVLIEKSNRVGGLVQTCHLDGCVLEAGADSYLAAKPSITELARELPGLDEQIIGSNDAARRVFIVRDSRLVPLPRGMVMMVPGDLPAALRSSLFSTKTKLRFLTEPLARPCTREKDVSVGEFIGGHFGPELVDYVAEPLLAGVYGGHSASLSAPSVLPRFVDYERAYGSLIRAVRKERRQSTGGLFRSFRDGMQTLTDALARQAQVHQAEAQRIESWNGRWRVHYGQEQMDVDDLVLACPAHAAAVLLESLSPSLACDLAAIPYSSAMLVSLVYQRSKVAHPLDGFGFLVPESERRTIAAATWVNTKFPSRIPPGLVALRAFIVADRAVELAGTPEPELIELVRSDFARTMGLQAAPQFSTVHAWPRSMPQYIVGHQERIGRITAGLREFPGLYLAGNAYDGIGLPDCVRLAKETAKRIHASKFRERIFTNIQIN